MVDRWEETPRLTRIFATIRVERPGQKAHRHRHRRAPCWKRSARWRAQEMEKLFGVKIYLDLHVRVQPAWREEAAFLNALDWRTMAVKMILRILLRHLALCLIASVCLAADKPVSDDAIYDKVRISLASDIDVKGGNLKVDVKEGVVTLAGTVESQRAEGQGRPHRQEGERRQEGGQ